ncbi:MAG: hypothetical protein KDD50_04235 [Bdellovibrionales bacterium]|nr:hypothetical protein [Bdellovibrionales bacterium]
MKALLYIFFISFLSTQAKAQTKYSVFALVCPDRIRLLDYFEGEELRGYQYQKDLSLQEKLNIVRVRMPDRSRLFSQYLLDYQSYETQDTLIPDPENRHEEWVIRPPENCKFSILLQSDLISKIWRNKDLWQKLSRYEREGVFFNWAIAKEIFATPQGLPHSTLYIRALNSILLQPEFNLLSLKELIQTLKVAHLTSLRVQTVLVDLSKKIQFYNDNIIQEAFPITLSSWPPIHLAAFDESEGLTQVLLKKDTVYFYENGQVKSLRFQDSLPLKTIGGVVYFSTPDHFKQWAPTEEEKFPRIYFYSNGFVKDGITIEPRSFETNELKVLTAQHKGRFENFDNSHLYFTEDGSLVTIGNSSGQIKINEGWYNIAKNIHVSWHRPGQLKELVVTEPVYLKAQGQNILWKGFLSFNTDGALNCGFIAQNYRFQSRNGSTKSARNGEQVCFDDNGLML